MSSLKVSLLFLQIIISYSNSDSTDFNHRRKRFRRNCLEILNVLRLIFQAPPLEWDDLLAERAQSWALYLSGRQDINQSMIRGSKYGDSVYCTEHIDNLDDVCFAAFETWFVEIDKKEKDNFRQMIWRSSRKIGIGEGGRATGKYFLVASFYPPGNVRGIEHVKENVLNYTKIPSSCILTICKLAQPGIAPQDLLNAEQEAFKLEQVFLKFGKGTVYNSSEPCVLPNATHSRCEYKDEVVEETLLQKQRKKVAVGAKRGTKVIPKVWLKALGRMVNGMKDFSTENKEIDTNESGVYANKSHRTQNRLKLRSEQNKNSRVQISSLKKPDTLNIIETLGTQRGKPEKIELTQNSLSTVDDFSKIMVIPVPEPLTTQSAQLRDSSSDVLTSRHLTPTQVSEEPENPDQAVL